MVNLLFLGHRLQEKTVFMMQQSISGVELNPGAPTPQSLGTPATKWIDFAEVQMGCSIWIPDTYQHTLLYFSSNIWSPFSISERVIRQDDNPESMIQMLQLYKQNTLYPVW